MIEKNSIYNEDCLGDKGMCLIDDKSIDLILCDLPYQMTANKWDVRLDLTLLWKEYKRVIKDNGVIALTASQPFTSILVMSNLDMFKYEWIWVKNRGGNFLNTKYMPMKEHENILIFYKKLSTYNPQYQQRTESGFNRSRHTFDINKRVTDNYGEFGKYMVVNLPELRLPSSVQKIKVESNGFHPTQKPVALMEYLIKTYTNEGDLVLDNCLGSGTTAVAAKQLNRNYIGFEKEKKYFDIAEKRIKRAKVQLTLNLGIN